MVNACFRCKTRIESGESFCSTCRERHGASLYPSRPEDRPVGESRLWILLVVVSALPWMGVAFSALPWVGARIGVAASALSMISSLLVYPVVLYYDAEHVREHDAAWSPSEWGYYALMAITFLVVFVAPIVTLYHLYRRKKAIGLPR